MASNIYRDKSLLKDAKNEQNETKILLNKLRNYNPTKAKKIKAKKETLSAVEKLLNNRQEVIDVFKTGIFPYEAGFQKEKSEEESEALSEDDFKKFIENIENESNYDLFKHYFNFVVTSALAKHYMKQKIKIRTTS